VRAQQQHACTKGEKKCVGWLSKIGVEGGKGKEFLAKACQKEVQG